jgi:hypothetical protein
MVHFEGFKKHEKFYNTALCGESVNLLFSKNRGEVTCAKCLEVDDVMEEFVSEVMAAEYGSEMYSSIPISKELLKKFFVWADPVFFSHFVEAMENGDEEFIWGIEACIEEFHKEFEDIEVN